MSIFTTTPACTHLVAGTDRRGQTLYYTGRSGELFVSPDRRQAFIGWAESGAQGCASNLNRGTIIHGITFRAEAA